CDEGDFGEVEAFAQKVDADEDVVLALAEVAEEFDAFEGFDFGVHIAAADADLGVVVGEVLGHALGEGGDEDALADLGARADLGEEVVDLALDGADLDLGGAEAGGADDLFDDDAGGFGEFVGAGRGGDVNDLAGARLELLELERAVVHGGGQAESVVDEVLLARAVAVPHAVELRDGDVRLVDEEEVVAGEVVEQGGRGLAGQAAGEVAGVVFDAVAVADGLDHFEVEPRSLMHALGFNEAALGFEFLLPPFELGEDAVDGGGFALGLDDVVRLGIDGQARVLLADGAEERVDLREGVDLVAEELDAIGVLVVGGIDLDHISADTEGAAAEVDIVAVIEDFDEAAGDVVALDALQAVKEEENAVVGLRASEAVDAGDGGDDDAVAALEEAARGGEPELVELLVDGGFLLDVEVAGGDVSLGLVVVVIADEVLDGVGGEEGLELVVELRGEGLVVREDERGPLHLLDDGGHGEGFAGAGDAEQDLVLFAGGEAVDELADGARLVALRAIGGGEGEVHLLKIRDQGLGNGKQGTGIRGAAVD